MGQASVMPARADTAAAGLAELLIGDAVTAAAALGKHLGLKPRADELPGAFEELAALRLSTAELIFEQEGAEFQRLAAPALLRRELANELRRPTRIGSSRRRLLKGTSAAQLAGLVDARKREYAAIATPAGVVDHHCRRLMEVTRRPMASAPAAWMSFRLAEVHAVHMATATATNLVEDGWFDAG